MPKAVYVIECFDGDDSHRLIKIGISKDPKERVEQLQRSNPHELELVEVFTPRKPREKEKFLLKLMQKVEKSSPGPKSKGGSEWFSVDDLAVYEIKEQLDHLCDFQLYRLCRRHLPEIKSRIEQAAATPP